MVARLDACNPDALRLLLADRLSPTRVGVLESHLEFCPHCRREAALKSVDGARAEGAGRAGKINRERLPRRGRCIRRRCAEALVAAGRFRHEFDILRNGFYGCRYHPRNGDYPRALRHSSD